MDKENSKFLSDFLINLPGERITNLSLRIRNFCICLLKYPWGCFNSKLVVGRVISKFLIYRSLKSPQYETTQFVAVNANFSRVRLLKCSRPN